MYNAALMGDISNILKEREQFGREKGREEGMEKGRLSSIACLLKRADEKTAKQLLDATDEEIKTAKELFIDGGIVLQ